MDILHTKWSVPKVLLILALAGALAGYLYVRHIVKEEKEVATLVDRMPTGHFLIRANILEVARETNGLLHANKVRFRDFFTYEFLLGQSKAFGIDLQSNSYIFANDTGEWGMLVAVKDSSKILEGVARLRQNLKMRDTVMYDRTCYFWPEEEGAMAYDANWLFIYKGKKFRWRLKRVVNAKAGDADPKWTDFLAEERFENQKFVLKANWPKLKEYGITEAQLAHDNDSTSFTVLTYFKNAQDWGFKLKDSGKALPYNSFTARYLNLHLDLLDRDLIRKDPKFIVLQNWSRKIGFPLHAFLDVWQGDLSFTQGGYLYVKEKIIETELDENFNPKEVVKWKDVKIPGYSLALTFDNRANSLFELLREKGIWTEEGNKLRFLFSPPLNYLKRKNYHLFYSSTYAPGLTPEKLNNGLLYERRTTFFFNLDSLSNNEAFGTMTFPVERLLNDNKFF